MERDSFIARADGDVHYAAFSDGVDLGPLSVCITGDWLPAHVVVRDDSPDEVGPGSFRLLLGCLKFAWSDVAPDRLVLQGRHPGDQSFEVDFAKQPRAKQRRLDGDEDDVPDFSSLFAPTAPAPRQRRGIDGDDADEDDNI